jgi:mannosyl-3-phosphoglycerate phosphatase
MSRSFANRRQRQVLMAQCGRQKAFSVAKRDGKQYLCQLRSNSVEQQPMPTATPKRKTKPPAKPGLVIFSDVDGTLLDFYSYSFDPAKAAVRELRRRSIPLVLVSSKTRAEIFALQKKLGIDTPFIAENGGAIFWPKSSAPEKPTGAKDSDGLWFKPLGTPYEKLRKCLIAFREEIGVKCEGFGDWTPRRIAELTGMPESVAPLAKKREFDEPFLFDPPPPPASLQQYLEALSSNGLSVLRGARFFHLVGKADKGRAVRELMKWYARIQPVKPRTLAFGDSPNDWTMMKECDIAVAVKRPDGKYHPDLRAHRGIRLAGASGPEGFNRMTLRLIKQLL